VTRAAPLRRLGGDRRGATAIEFGFVAPVMLVLMMGAGDLAYQVYVQAILDGAIQKAARDSAIQGGADQTAVIDNRVLTQVRTIAGSATIAARRTSYTKFGDVKPEPFTDENANGVRDPGECFTDINGNRSWDQDPGGEGQGGANDVTRYRLTITYKQPFAVMRIFGANAATKALTSETLLKNQPYASQAAAGTPATVCT
jgi:Flp pilus assembly protein TadG